MKKIIFSLVGIVILFIGFSPAILLAEQDDTVIGLPNPNLHPCIVLTEGLSVGATDAKTNGQVTKLQKFLQAKKQIDSAGVTGYFGPATKDALKKFQSQKKLEAVGFVGPKTKSVLGEGCAPTVSTEAPVLLSPAIVSTTVTTSVTPHAPSFIAKLVSSLNPVVLIADVIQYFTGTPIMGDINRDGKVDSADTAILSVAYGSRTGDANWNADADLNNDGVINVADLGILATNMGQTDMSAAPPPTVTITTPTNNSVVSGSVDISTTVSSRVGVTKVELYKDGTLFSTDTTAPYSFTWAAPLSDLTRSYVFTAKAYNSSGKVGSSAPVTFSVAAVVGGSPINSTAVYSSGADFNNDGIVNVTDLGILSTYYGLGTGVPPKVINGLSVADHAHGDGNGDGVVNVTDLGILSSAYGSSRVVIPDTTIPTVSITPLANTQNLSGTVTISATASDNVAVTKVDFYKNNVLFSTISSAPFSVSWNTLLEANGTFNWTAKAYDAAGNVSNSTAVSLIINNLFPVVTFSATATTIDYNTATTLTWSSTGAASCTASGSWSGTQAVSGSLNTGNLTVSKTYTLACTNTAGTTSKTVMINVGGAPLTPTLILTAQSTSLAYNTATTLSWSSQYATTCISSGSWSGTQAVTGFISTGNLTVNKTYTLVCTGLGGNVTKSVTITVGSAPDTTLPTITISAPADGAVVSGPVSILAAASDNVAVTKVELYKDGVLYQTDTTSPYSFSWTAPVSTANIQSFVFTEKAYDAAGNVGLSNTVALKVAAVVVGAPTVTLKADSNSLVSGGSSVLTWTSINADTCVASGAWSGAQIISGILAISPTASATYTLTCTGIGGTTAASATVTVTPATSSSVAVSVKNMVSFNELYIEGSLDNDTIGINQSGNTITVSANGTNRDFVGPFGDIVVKGGEGNDSINIGSSITARVLAYGGNGNNVITASGNAKITMVSIGGGVDILTGNGKTNYWVGAEDSARATSAETAAGMVHVVSSFANYSSLALNGPNIPDPTDTSFATNRLNGYSLFGQGVDMNDINQGAIADCYYLAGLSSLAYNDPNTLEKYAADLGDNTYVVQYALNGMKSYVRVDSDLDSLNNTQGPTGNIWGMVFEKAYAYFRSNANTYASLNTGSASQAMRDFGVAATAVAVNSATAEGTAYTTISTPVAAHKPETANTLDGGSTLANSHSYAVISTSKDSSGNMMALLRNPWGNHDGGDGPSPLSDSNPADAMINLPITLLKGALKSASYAQ